MGVRGPENVLSRRLVPEALFRGRGSRGFFIGFFEGNSTCAPEVKGK